MVQVLGPTRRYFLFDSFEGPSAAQEDVDGTAAIVWQSKTDSPTYYNNCGAPEESHGRDEAVGCDFIIRWSRDGSTKPCRASHLRPKSQYCASTATGTISTRVCLENLYPHVGRAASSSSTITTNWEGCARAVQMNFSPDRIDESRSEIAGSSTIAPPT